MNTRDLLFRKNCARPQWSTKVTKSISNKMYIGHKKYIKDKERIGFINKKKIGCKRTKRILVIRKVNNEILRLDPNKTLLLTFLHFIYNNQRIYNKELANHIFTVCWFIKYWSDSSKLWRFNNVTTISFVYFLKNKNKHFDL